MTRDRVSTGTQWEPIVGYSRAVRVGRFVYVSGTTATNTRGEIVGQDPTYVTDASTRFGTLFRVDKLLPDSWGLSIPVNVQYVRSSADPFYISRSDVLAEALPGLREPRTSLTSVDVALRRVASGDDFLERLLLDPVSLRLHHASASDVASFQRAKTENQLVELGYSYRPPARTVSIVPGFIVDLVDALPDWIGESEFGKGLRSSRLRVNPVHARFSTSLTDFATERFVFRVPVELAADTSLPALRSVIHTWRNETEIDLRPFSSLSLRVTHASLRDLQDYGDSTTIGRLLEDERRRVLGTDVGFERERRLGTVLAVTPVVSSWLRPRLTFASTFSLLRDPNARSAVRREDDTTGAFLVPQTLAHSRRRELGTSVDLARLGRGIGAGGVATALLGSLLPADVSYTLERRAVFDRAPFDPDLGFHLAFGDRADFLTREGVLATSAAELTDVTASGGTRLPFGGQLRVTYREGDNIVWLRRGAEQSQISQHHEEWPSLVVSWAYTPRWPLTNAITAHVRYQETERVTVQPVFGEVPGVDGTVRTENRVTLVTPSLSVSWVGGVTTTGQLTYGNTDLITAGNLTHSERRDWGGSVNFAFRLPRALFPTRDLVRASVAFNSSDVAACLRRADAVECRTVSDSRRRQFDVRLDTGFSEALRGGATFSYVVSDQRHTSNKLSQVVLTIFADVNLFAGELR